MNKPLFFDLKKPMPSKCLILGTGISINDIHDYKVEDTMVIGVNKISPIYQPDILVVTDRIPDDCVEISCSTARLAYTKHMLPLHCLQVLIYVKNLYNTTVEKIFQENAFVGSNTVMSVAISLALRMQFNSIGILGFDITRDHDLYRSLRYINTVCKHLNDYAIQNGIEIYNCSDVSNITAFKHKDLRAFLYDVH